MKKLLVLLFVLFSSLSIFAQADTSSILNVTINANNTLVYYGGSSYVYWTSKNASYCIASGGNNDWAGYKSTEGIYYTGALIETQTFCITAFNESGASASSCVTINVTPIVYTTWRLVGSGTHIRTSLYAMGSIDRFEMTIEKYSSNIQIETYFSNEVLSNWYVQSYSNYNYLKVAAIGEKISLNGESLGALIYYIPENFSGNYFLPYINFYDGKRYWPYSNQSGIKVINLSVNSYGDLDRNNILNINDAKIMYDLLGETPDNDTLQVLSDLSGTGNEIDSWELYLLLAKITNPDYIWPIFYNYDCDCGNGYGSTIPIKATWQKMNNGKWGLFSQDTITNGDLIGKNLSNIQTSTWSKKIDNKYYFINQSQSIKNPILISDSPIEISGTVNNGRPIVVEKTSVTDVAEEKIQPKEFSLAQNYPNPFNPSTTISYTLPIAGLVSLKVYDVLGNEVATLVNEEKTAGNYEVNFNASNLSSGTYIYKISAGDFVQTKKMILMK